MSCTQEPWLLVHVGDRTKISTNDLKVCILAYIIFGHFEHSKMQIGDGAEGSAGHQNYRCLLWISENSGETMMGETVIWGVHEGGSWIRRGLHGREGEGGIRRITKVLCSMQPLSRALSRGWLCHAEDDSPRKISSQAWSSSFLVSMRCRSIRQQQHKCCQEVQ